MQYIKYLVICLISIIGTAFACYAGPYIVTDSFKTGVVTSCIFVLNSGETVTIEPTSIDSDNSVCKYDVGTVAVDGDNSITVQYKNMWGSSVSDPFLFTKVVPVIPSGIHLEE